MILVALFSREARASERSELEKSIAEEALQRWGWEAEEHPTGKKIEAVEVYALEVFDDRDPIPSFVNALHTTTRDYVIRRELLFSVGELWSSQRVEETERNLRDLRQLSLANVVAARGSSAETVRLIVIVKDVWSLRLNSDFGLGDDGLERLYLNPAEENLAGTQMSVGLHYLLDPFRHTFGAGFIQPRLGGTRYWVGGQAALITNRETMELEGSSGQFVFEFPQYSLRTPFAYGVNVRWLQETTRRTRGTELRTIDVELPSGEVEQIPWAYRTERLAGEYYGVRSFGVLEKFDLRFGLEVDQRRYRSQELSEYDPVAQEIFRTRVLPVSDVRISPFLQMRKYQGRFHRLLNLEILGLQEDYRLGHDLLLRVFAAGERLGSSRDLIGATAALGYTWALGTGLLRAVVQSRTVLANEARNEALATAGLRFATPVLGPGRLHIDADVAVRYYDYLNVAPFALGGNGRLRGYRFNEFQGENLAVMNVEYRSRGVDVLSAQVGWAAFYDVGDVPEHFSKLHLRHSAGVGLRVLFPQMNRSVLRVDWGIPLNPTEEIRPGAVYVSFGQAFGLPRISTPSVTDF